MKHQGQTGIYFHWPFCLSKCPYCDFNVHVRDQIDHALWAQRYLDALEYYSKLLPARTIQSVFFGGGTPSLMAPETVGRILEKVKKLWPVANDIEITLEANPTSVEIEKFRAFSEAGVNRVSLGVQSLIDEDLKFLGRTHSAADAIKAIETAASVFDRYSFDLIYARPNQNLKAWEAELRQAIDYADGHLSLYQLTIERNTPFYFAHEQGGFSVPEEGLAADFYDLTQEVLAEHDLPAYEVSNHARIGNESLHNMIYWNYDDYIGIGPGAHGRITKDGRKYATRDHHAPDIWLENVAQKSCASHPFELLDEGAQVTECLMMGLRLQEGIPLERLEALSPDWRSVLDMDKARHMMDEGWLIMNNQRLALTQEGRLRLNAILRYVLRIK